MLKIYVASSGFFTRFSA